MKAWLAKMAVKGIKVAIRAFGEGVVGAALEHIRKEKDDETQAAAKPWSKAIPDAGKPTVIRKDGPWEL